MKPFPLASFPLACCLASCVSGPTYESIAGRIPPLSEHCARIYCFRAVIEANLVRPRILLNGAEIGRSEAGGFFFVDRPAGDYVLTTSHPAGNELALHLKEKETCYVESLVLTASFDRMARLDLCEPAYGEGAVRELKYTGPELQAPKPKP